jgi:hypothetical protein
MRRTAKPSMLRRRISTQPALIAARDLLINHAASMGGQELRRLAVTRGGSGWNVDERWTSRGNLRSTPYLSSLRRSR